MKKYLLRFLFTIIFVHTSVVHAESMPAGAMSIPLKPFNGGALITLGSVKAKYILVDFWASWCIPCRASFPFYSSLNQKYASKGLAIVAVDSEDDMKAARDFLADTQPNFITVHDGGKLSGMMNLPKMPTSYIIDRQGKIVYTHPGFYPGDESAIEAKVNQLLGK